MRPKLSKLLICIALLSVLLAVPACLVLEDPYPREAVKMDTPTFDGADSFEKIFVASGEIDKKYGTSFHKEAIGKFVVDIQDVDNMIKDVDGLIRAIDPSIEPLAYDPDIIVNKSFERSEKDLGLLFLFARRRMLQSEKEFQMGYRFGYNGLVTSEFYCAQAPKMVESLDHFHESVVHGVNANYYLDTVLTGGPDITWGLVGVEENKPLFYTSPLRDMTSQISKNRDVLEGACGNATMNTKVIVEGLSI